MSAHTRYYYTTATGARGLYKRHRARNFERRLDFTRRDSLSLSLLLCDAYKKRRKCPSRARSAAA